MCCVSSYRTANCNITPSRTQRRNIVQVLRRFSYEDTSELGNIFAVDTGIDDIHILPEILDFL